MSTPTHKPRSFAAGETVSWEKSLDDYSSQEGWSLTYHFRGAGALDQAAVAQADGSCLITVPAAKTAELAAGTYYWQAWVKKAGEKYRVASGEVRVEQGLSGDVGAYDGRSEVKRTLDAIDARIRGRADADVHMYMIGNRQLMKIPMGDLLALRKYYASLYAQERRRARARGQVPVPERQHEV